MGILFSENLTTLDDLFVHNLKAILYAEGQIASALPKMAEMATNADLKAGFERHLVETQTQIERLKQVFDIMGLNADEGSCPAIDGIVKDNDRMAGNIEDSSALDAALAFGAQCVEHHEIAVYGTLVSWAKELGRQDVLPLLEATLAEEHATNDMLTGLAEARLNVLADREQETTMDVDMRTDTTAGL